MHNVSLALQTSNQSTIKLYRTEGTMQYNFHRVIILSPIVLFSWITLPYLFVLRGVASVPDFWKKITSISIYQHKSLTLKRPPPLPPPNKKNGEKNPLPPTIRHLYNQVGRVHNYDNYSMTIVLTAFPHAGMSFLLLTCNYS